MGVIVQLAWDSDEHLPGGPGSLWGHPTSLVWVPWLASSPLETPFLAGLLGPWSCSTHKL